MDAQIERFATVVGTPYGSTMMVVGEDHTVIWLLGEVDLALEAELAVIRQRVPMAPGGLVVDCSNLTFADSALINFVAALLEVLPVTIRRPGPLVLHLLTVAGLTDRLGIDHGLPLRQDSADPAR